MPLELRKHIGNATREELEAFLTIVQAKRTQAAVEYHETKTAKLETTNQRLKDRIERQCDMLGKNILALDRMMETVQLRMDNIEQMRQEAGFADDEIARLLLATGKVK